MKIRHAASWYWAKLVSPFLLMLIVANCASPRPRSMLGDEDFAIIYTTPVECIARGACVATVSIRAINDKAISNLTTKYNYQVLPGELSVIVLAHPVLGDGIKYVQGVCELKWIAVPGKLYLLDRTIEKNGFLVTAKEKDGEEVASCLAAFV